MTEKEFLERYFNPRAPCGARRLFRLAREISARISIHAPLAGRDTTTSTAATSCWSFQSTRPLRGATCTARIEIPAARDFNPRAPCGARPETINAETTDDTISIHAPLAGRDLRYDAPHLYWLISIHAPLAGRDNGIRRQGRGRRISIHAPLAGRDTPCARGTVVAQHFNPRAPCGARLSHYGTTMLSTNFNPRAPCGARPGIRRRRVLRALFQSTRPLRGATVRQFLKLRLIRISIHAPLAGRDYHRHTRRCGHRYFNPRAPCGARPEIILVFRHGVEISIHAPLAGRDHEQVAFKRVHADFNPRAPCGARRHQHQPLSVACLYFNPRAPCGARPNPLEPP